jgi:cytochrome c oxidase subunit II
MNSPFARPLATLALAAFATVLGVCVLTGRADASAPIQITAQDFSFSPAKITAHVGQKTTLRLSSNQGVHGLESKDLGIPQTVIAPGKSVDVTFTPTKAGTYTVQCAIPCGEGHDKMMLVIVVEP